MMLLAGRKAMEDQDYAALADLMDENFALRRKLYTDAVRIQLNRFKNAFLTCHVLEGRWGWGWA